MNATREPLAKLARGPACRACVASNLERLDDVHASSWQRWERLSPASQAPQRTNKPPAPRPSHRCCLNELFKDVRSREAHCCPPPRVVESRGNLATHIGSVVTDAKKPDGMGVRIGLSTGLCEVQDASVGTRGNVCRVVHVHAIDASRERGERTVNSSEAIQVVLAKATRDAGRDLAWDGRLLLQHLADLLLVDAKHVGESAARDPVRIHPLAKNANVRGAMLDERSLALGLLRPIAEGLLGTD